jgi:hypothetical protein
MHVRQLYPSRRAAGSRENSVEKPAIIPQTGYPAVRTSKKEKQHAFA